MQSVSRTLRLALVAALVVAMLPAGVALAAGKGKTYTAPYQEGPTTGDRWAMSQQTPEDGRVFVGRMYPIFNPISCAPGGAMAKLSIKHKVTGPLKSVTADFDQAVFDGYTFATVAVKDKAGNWLASDRVRGPVAGSGTVTAKFQDTVKRGQVVTIQFGMEMASACPNLGGGTARFTQVTVN
jgi:hypothetical protein